MIGLKCKQIIDHMQTEEINGGQGSWTNQKL